VLRDEKIEQTFHPDLSIPSYININISFDTSRRMAKKTSLEEDVDYGLVCWITKFIQMKVRSNFFDPKLKDESESSEEMTTPPKRVGRPRSRRKNENKLNLFQSSESSFIGDPTSKLSESAMVALGIVFEEIVKEFFMNWKSRVSTKDDYEGMDRGFYNPQFSPHLLSIMIPISTSHQLRGLNKKEFNNNNNLFDQNYLEEDHEQQESITTRQINDSDSYFWSIKSQLINRLQILFGKKVLSNIPNELFEEILRDYFQNEKSESSILIPENNEVK